MEVMIWNTAEDETERINALQRVLHACQQSQQTYAAAARVEASAKFTILFGTLATEREQAACSLQQALLRLGDTSQLTGTASDEADASVDGTDNTHRIPGNWNDMQHSDTLLWRQTLLEACERQEQYTLEQYERLLQMVLPADIADLARQQYGQVTAALLSIGVWKPL